MSNWLTSVAYRPLLIKHNGCSWQDKNVINLKKNLLFFTLSFIHCISNLICEFGLRFCAYIHRIIFNYLHKSYKHLLNFWLFLLKVLHNGITKYQSPSDVSVITCIALCKTHCTGSTCKSKTVYVRLQIFTFLEDCVAFVLGIGITLELI